MIHYAQPPNLSSKPIKIIYLQQKIFASVCLAGWVSGSAAAVWSPDVTAARWAAADHLCSTQQVQWPAGAVTSVHPDTARDGSKQRVEVSISSANLTNFIAILKLWERERTSFESLLFYLSPRYLLNYKINCIDN